MTHKNTLRFLNDEQFLLLFNFSPAASVTVIDIVNRKIIAEAAIAGCTLVYPSGKLSFGSLCGDNTRSLWEDPETSTPTWGIAFELQGTRLGK